MRDDLPHVPIQDSGEISNLFLQLGIHDFATASQYIQSLPYGRNKASHFHWVLQEKRGTCSTKHALLAKLAMELDIPYYLHVGIYEMSERNTPGVGSILSRYDLISIPEAHCYLKYREKRLDFTQAQIASESPFASLLYEESMEPEQIGEYKTTLHQAFIDKWIIQQGLECHWNSSTLWQVREACIAALSQK